MEANANAVGDLTMKEKMKKESAAESEDDEPMGGGAPEDDKRKRAASTGKRGGGDSSMRNCQVEKCSSDLSDAKTYHRRHKVCELHAKAQVVVVAGIRQRFCQQCSRFHELAEFDEAKRSCRRRLAGHNERRRKTHPKQKGRPAAGLRAAIREKILCACKSMTGEGLMKTQTTNTSTSDDNPSSLSSVIIFQAN